LKEGIRGIGQPIREDKWHSTPNTTSSLATMHFIPDMMSLQNNNNYDLNHQRYTQIFSASQYSKKGDDTSKKEIDNLRIKYIIFL
jgi:hypothetical protein